MNFNDNHKNCQKMLSEIIEGFFGTYLKYSMLNKLSWITRDCDRIKKPLLLESVLSLQHALYFSCINDLFVWFIDKHSDVASLPNLIGWLEREDFCEELKNWYSRPPSTTNSDPNPTNFCHDLHIEKQEEKFVKDKILILKGYEKFKSFEKDIKNLRNKRIAHKDFKKSEIFNPEVSKLEPSIEERLEDLKEIIFPLNELFNKSHYKVQLERQTKIGEALYKTLVNSLNVTSFTHEN